MTAAPSTLRTLVSLATPFWRSKQRGRAILLLASAITFTLGLVAIAVLLTYWQRAFYNSLEDRNWTAFINLLVSWETTPQGWMPGFGPILAIYVVFTVYALYLKQALQIRWREWMTHDYVDRWMSGRHYYLSGLGIGRTDNPDQRIAEDVAFFVEGALTLGLGFLRAVVSLISFIVLLWSLSEPMVIEGISVPGYLVWLALLYSAAGTIGTHFFGFRLIGLNFRRQSAEADFRYGLIQVRDNAESVALHQGEDSEKRVLAGLFAQIVANWQQIMSITKQMTFFTSAYNQAALVFPLGISAPAYFAGRIQLGGIFQTAGAFVQVQVALSWVVDNYAKIAELIAAMERLRGFREAQEEAARHRCAIAISQGGQALEASELTVQLPDGRPIVDRAGFRAVPGERILITGASGTGKSTFLRALVGIWPYGSGRLRKPLARFAFLPQKAYVPTGTLRHALSYPQPEHHFPDRDICDALEAVGLSALSIEVGRRDNWRDRLSGGEAQRIALARALLARPDWLVLDEATANLDLVWERRFYQIIEERLPRAAVISVAHRSEALLHRVFALEGGRLVET